jgi:hypothetical protein
VNNSILRGAQLIELNSADVRAISKRPEHKCEIEHARFQNLHGGHYAAGIECDSSGAWPINQR